MSQLIWAFRLIWVFSGRTCHLLNFCSFVVLRFIFYIGWQKRPLTSTIDDNRRGVNSAAVNRKNINLTCDYEFGRLDGLRTKHKQNNSGLKKKNVKTLSIRFNNRVFRSKIQTLAGQQIIFLATGYFTQWNLINWVKYDFQFLIWVMSPKQIKFIGWKS